MSTGDAGSGVPLGSQQQTFPVPMLHHSVSGVASDDTTFTNHHGGLMVVQCIDATAGAVSADTPQLIVSFSISGVVFYYDSQSIGEGLGVRFSWRGAQIIEQFGDLEVSFLSLGGGNVNWAVMASGIAGPFPRNF